MGSGVVEWLLCVSVIRIFFPAVQRHHTNSTNCHRKTPIISGTFGCATGAFSYSTLNTRKNADADSHNPNLYSSIEDLKDNRIMENIYDEIQKRASASASVQRKGFKQIC